MHCPSSSQVRQVDKGHVYRCSITWQQEINPWPWSLNRKVDSYARMGYSHRYLQIYHSQQFLLQGWIKQWGKKKNLILVIVKSLDCIKYCLYAKGIVFISDIKAKTELRCLLSKCLLKGKLMSFSDFVANLLAFVDCWLLVLIMWQEEWEQVVSVSP